jgi:hypothetical protein
LLGKVSGAKNGDNLALCPAALEEFREIENDLK